jgi:putative nucleotidyltransferase with HDIG domain
MDEKLLQTSSFATLSSEADEQVQRKMKQVVSQIQNLPTPPAVFGQINSVISDPDASAYDVACIISEDPALSAKILKLTNSTIYGIPRTVTNVKQAVVILGLEVVKSLVISASVFEMFSKNDTLDEEYLDYFWRHSLTVALMARIISRQERFSSYLNAEMAFSAGMLHDIGKLIIVAELRERHQNVMSLLAGNSLLSEFDAEKDVFGFTHADIGAYLCARWNLPEPLCRAIARHHDEATVASDTWVALIHLSNYLGHQMDLLYNRFYPNPSKLCEPAWFTLNLSPGQKESLIASLKSEYSRAEVFIKLARGLEHFS